jgi:general stress protein 26
MNERVRHTPWGTNSVEKDNVRKLRAVLQCLDTVMLTTVDDRYHLVSRPMAVRVDDEFDGLLRLFAPTQARCVAHTTARAWVNVSHTSPSASVSLSGFAALGTDRDRIARYSHDGLNP